MVSLIKKWLSKYVVPGIFVIGVLIFFYPIVGNWLSTKEHYQVISRHNEVLAQMNKEEKEREKEKAKQYNDSITERDIPIVDPFSEEAETQVESKSYYNVLNIGEAMGTIEIPSINVNLPIYHGASEEVLSQGIGHLSNSSLPIGGKGTHSALTGHRGLPSSKLFRHLDKLEIGDVFFINTLGEKLAYKVDDIKIVLPHETNWLEIVPDKDYVTLITCEPYMINTHRLLVRGERVPYIEETLADSSPELNNKLQNYRMWVLISSVLGIIIITYLYLRKKRLRERE